MGNDVRPVVNHPPDGPASSINVRPFVPGPTVVMGRYPTKAKASEALKAMQARRPDRVYRVRRVDPWQIVACE